MATIKFYFTAYSELCTAQPRPTTRIVGCLAVLYIVVQVRAHQKPFFVPEMEKIHFDTCENIDVISSHFLRPTAWIWNFNPSGTEIWKCSEVRMCELNLKPTEGPYIFPVRPHIRIFLNFRVENIVLRFQGYISLELTSSSWSPDFRHMPARLQRTLLQYLLTLNTKN